MSVLIKGMEMPKDCIFCPVFHGAWTICRALNKTTSVRGRPDDCPLVPVPPHGDLIDRDAYEYPGDLMDEPVIIPAEEGE